MKWEKVKSENVENVFMENGMRIHTEIEDGNIIYITISGNKYPIKIKKTQYGDNLQILEPKQNRKKVFEIGFTWKKKRFITRIVEGDKINLNTLYDSTEPEEIIRWLKAEYGFENEEISDIKTECKSIIMN